MIRAQFSRLLQIVRRVFRTIIAWTNKVRVTDEIIVPPVKLI